MYIVCCVFADKFLLYIRHTIKTNVYFFSNKTRKLKIHVENYVEKIPTLATSKNNIQIRKKSR